MIRVIGETAFKPFNGMIVIRHFFFVIPDFSGRSEKSKIFSHLIHKQCLSSLLLRLSVFIAGLNVLITENSNSTAP